MADSQPMNGDQDEVVKEIPVYLTKALKDKLILLQYPLRPADRPYDSRNVLSARIKPRQQKLEIEMAIDTQGQNFDCLKAEQIAINTDGDDANYTSGKTYFRSPQMDKQVLMSTSVPLSSRSYAVGKFSDGKLHITPLKSALQMKPSFEYLDIASKYGHDEASGEVKEPEAEAVTVKFAGPNSERAQKAREKSYSFLQQRMEAEPWVPLKYNAIGSRKSKYGVQQLLYKEQVTEKSNNPAPEDYSNYLLVPKCLMQSHVNSKSSSQIEKVRPLMESAQVLSFYQVMEQVPAEQAANVERVLQQIALLVKGCWVIRSEIIFPKDYASPLTGAGSETLCRTRDYILWTFTKSDFIKINDIKAVISVSIEDLIFILSRIAKKVYNKGWEFKCDTDDYYIENHKIIVQRQDILWDVRYKQLLRDFRSANLDSDNLTLSFPPPPSPKERRHFKYRESFSGDDTEESGCESSSSEKMEFDFTKKGRMIKKTASFNKKRTPTSPVKTRSRHPSATGFDIDPRVLSALPSADNKAELINHVKCVVQETYCLTLNALKESLAETKLAFIAEREDCDSLLEEALAEIGAQKLKNKWPRNTQPAVLYAYTKFGTEHDRYRNALLDLFTNTARSRPNFLIKKLEDENGEIISESLCRQIFEEYCLYKSGYYYLKGTITLDFY